MEGVLLAATATLAAAMAVRADHVVGAPAAINSAIGLIIIHPDAVIWVAVSAGWPHHTAGG